MEAILDLIIFGAVYYFVLRPRWRQLKENDRLIRHLFAAYLLCVCIITILPIVAAIPFVLTTHFPRVVNGMPFIDVVEHQDGAITQVLLNVLLTMPFGYLFPLLFKVPQRSFKRTLLATVVCTLSIETLQFILANGRITDVTDVITNTLGGVIGYGLYKVTRQLTIKYYKQSTLNEL